MKTKVINLTVNDCRQCPFYKKFGVRNAPGCGHFKYKLEPFGVKILPNINETDEYNHSIVAVFTGGIPDWCPLEDLHPLIFGKMDWNPELVEVVSVSIGEKRNETS